MAKDKLQERKTLHESNMNRNVMAWCKGLNTVTLSASLNLRTCIVDDFGRFFLGLDGAQNTIVVYSVLRN